MFRRFATTSIVFLRKFSIGYVRFWLFLRPPPKNLVINRLTSLEILTDAIFADPRNQNFRNFNRAICKLMILHQCD